MAEKFQEIIELAFQTLGADEAAAFEKSLRRIGDAGADVDDKLSPLLDQFDELATLSARVAQAIDISDKIQANNSALVEAKAQLAGLNAEFSKTDKSSVDVQLAFANAEKRVKSLAAEQLKLQTASAQVGDALKASGVDTTNLGAAQEQLKAKAAGVAQQITTTANAAKSAGQNLKGAAEGARTLGDESKRSTGFIAELKDNLGKIISVAAAVELALKGIEFGRDSFKEAADLEESLSRIGAKANAAKADLEGFESGIRAAAEEAKVSAEAAASGIAALVEQGRSADEALKALVPTLLLAKDAQIDVAQAASLVDGALSQFGASADDAGKFVDILVAASKGSKDGLLGLAEGIGKVAPLARDLNLTFEDTVGILGFMTRNGLSAGDATKGLGAIFRDLADPASKLRQQLFDLGDGTSDFDQAITTLANSGQRGKDAITGLDDSTRKVILFLTQQGVPALNAFRAGLGNVEGEASRTAKALGDNLNGAFGDFTRAIDEIGARLAQPVLAPLRGEFETLAVRLNAFANSPAFAQIQDAIGELARNGIQAIDKFLQGIDWNAFVGGARTAIGDASKAIASFKDDLVGVTDTLNLVGRVIGVVYRAIASVFDVAKVTISALVSKGSIGQLADLSAQLDKLTGSTSKTTIALESVRDSADRAMREGIVALKDNVGKLGDNLVALGGAGAAATDGLDTVEQHARAAATSFQGVAAGVESTAAAFEDFTNVGPPAVSELRAAAATSGEAFQQLQRDIEAARAEVDTARAKLDQLTRSGQSNSEAFLAAQRAYDAAERALAQLQGRMGTTAGGADALKAKLDQIGGSSQTLKKNADDAAHTLDETFAAFLRSTKTLEDVRTAFDAYAAAQLDSVKNSESWKQQTVRAMLEVKAASVGLSDIKLPDFEKGSKFSADYAASIDRLNQTQRVQIDTSTTASRAIAASATATEAARQPLQGFSIDLSQFSKTAIEAYAAVQAAALKFGASNDAQLQAYVQSVNVGNRQITQSIADQQQTVNDFIGTFTDLTDAQLANQARMGGGYDALLLQVRGVVAETQDATGEFSLLNDADLSRVQSAASAVEQRLQAIVDRANAGKQALQDMANGFQDQIDTINGNQTDIENRQFQSTLERIKQEAEASGNVDTEAYNNAVANATSLHELRLGQIADEAEAKKKADEDAAARKKKEDSTSASTNADRATATNTPSKTEQQQNGGTVLGTIKFDFGNGQSFDVRGTRETKTDFEALVRELNRQRTLRPGPR
jgi:TP901 family phage tail tape measure protein